MALPITNISLESDIAPEFSETASLEICSLSNNVNKNGLNPTYCPGTTSDLRLSNLRNDKRQSYFKGYNVGTGGLSLTYSFNSTLSDDFLEVYDVTITASGAFPANANLGFELEFTSGSVPAGQQDRRQVMIENVDAANSITLNSTNPQSTIFTSFGIGDEVRNFRYTYENDNWDSPRPNSTFKVTCHGDYQLSVISGEQQSVIVNGVTTTFLELNSANSTSNNSYDIVDIGSTIDISDYSGETIITIFTRQDGPTYTSANGYKDVQVVEDYDTVNFNANLKFIQIVWDISSTPYETYTGDEYRHGAQDFTTLTTTSNYPVNGFGARYALINSTGNSGSFSWTVSPNLYCSFTSTNITRTLTSRAASDSILFIKEINRGGFTYRVTLDRLLLAANSDTDITLGDRFSYRFIARCPNGGNISIRNEFNTLITSLSNGQSYLVDNAGAGIKFLTEVGDVSPISTAATYLSIADTPILTFDINQNDTGQYVEIEAVSNCTTGISPYRWKFDDTGTLT